MTLERILDRRGALLAQIMREANGNITLLDKKGAVVGRYQKSCNTVYDRTGRYMGHGSELLMTLIHEN
jgi:hypothetical protein